MSGTLRSIAHSPIANTLGGTGAHRRPPRSVSDADGRTAYEMRDMLVDFAPYLFRGSMAGFLTRLSSTGLANVTSGGGQVPAMVVDPLSK